MQGTLFHYIQQKILILIILPLFKNNSIDPAPFQSQYSFANHSMYKIIILLLSILCLTQQINLIYYDSLPVSRLALYKALLSMSYLKNDLDRSFNTKWENKHRYYVRTKLTEAYLTDVSNELKSYNNVLMGNNNGVSGKANLIVGDKNSVFGSDNWVFTQGFNGQADKDLILDKWQVEVDKAESIPVDPRIAIRQW